MVLFAFIGRCLNICRHLIWLIIVLSFLPYGEIFPQFDSLLFKKEFYLNHDYNLNYRRSVHPAGDLNQDGYDDFLVYDCREEKTYIFFGGNPVDTIPELVLDFDWASYALIDLNNDTVKDLVFITGGPISQYRDRKILVYFGGVQLDTIPDISFSPPPGVTHNFGYFTHVLEDFNGDGRSELVIFDPFLPFSSQYVGIFYFYNTGSVFDTIPEITMMGDSVNYLRYDFGISSSGDINGDGKTDFTLKGYIKEGGVDRYFRRFYLGNEDFNLEYDTQYFFDEHTFKPDYMHITGDLNKDGKSEIIMLDYGFYPYWYYTVILSGNYPIDTIPTFGLNTGNLGLNPAVTILGDVNGDGFKDFLGTTYASPYAPVIALWLGGRKIHEIPDKVWYSADCIYSYGGFGSTHNAVGDINGDGVDDIAIGQVTCVQSGCNPGKIYIFSGDTTVHADTVLSFDDQSSLPSGYEIFAPYPNPFNPSVTLSFRIPVYSRIRITIYDILGRQVGVLLDEERNRGEYKIELNADKYGLSSGVYIAEFITYSQATLTFKENKKITLIR